MYVQKTCKIADVRCTAPPHPYNIPGLSANRKLVATDLEPSDDNGFESECLTDVTRMLYVCRKFFDDYQNL